MPQRYAMVMSEGDERKIMATPDDTGRWVEWPDYAEDHRRWAKGASDARGAKRELESDMREWITRAKLLKRQRDHYATKALDASTEIKILKSALKKALKELDDA